MLGRSYCTGFSLVVASRGYPLVVVCGPLTVVASHVAAQALGHTGFHRCSSQALEHRLHITAYRISCSAVCGIFPDQEI